MKTKLIQDFKKPSTESESYIEVGTLQNSHVARDIKGVIIF